MSSKQIEKKLGRGIASLLEMDNDLCAELHINTSKSGSSSNFAERGSAKKYNQDAIQNELQELKIDDIEPNPNQPRRHFDENKLKELSLSIKNNGLIQPIIVKKNRDNSGDGINVNDSNNVDSSCKKYTIIAGERRYRASKLAGLNKIKAVVLNVKEQEILKKAVIENVQRENLNPIEEASSYKHIIETYNYTHEQLAKEIGKSRAYVTNLLRILSLPDEVRLSIQNDDISLGHAKVLLSVNKPEKYLNTIIQQKLSVRQLEKLIANDKTNDQNNKSKKNNKTKKVKNADNNKVIDVTDAIASVASKDIVNLVSQIYTKYAKDCNTFKNCQNIDKQLCKISGFNLHLVNNSDLNKKIEIVIESKNELTELLTLISKHKN